MSAILIVDDHEQNRYLLRAMLTASGDEVMEAANGAEALELARRSRPDLIISDVLMPQMDGFALCRECKRDEKLRDIPFMFYTATYTDPRDEALALQLGAARYIIKPVESEEFIAILREVMQADAAGQPAAIPSVLEEETVFFRLYNEALIRKLEDKMLELERINRSLAESEGRFRRLAENASDLIYRFEFTPQRGFTYVSPAATAVTGYTPEEHYADPDLGFKLVHPDDRPLLEEALGGESAPGELLTLRWVHKGGGIIWTEQRNVPIFNEVGELVAIEGIARDISERKGAERRIKLQLQRLHALHNIDRAISSSFDLRVALDLLLEQVIAQLSVDAADILLFNQPRQSLEFAAGRGFHSGAIQQAQMRIGEGYAGRAALERRTVHIPNMNATGSEVGRSLLMEREAFVVYYGVPLIAKGWVKGVLEIFQRAPLEPDSEWLDFLETLAGQAAIAIDNAQMFDGLQHSNIKLLLAYDATIEGWSRAMDLRDKETEGHTQRVSELTVRLAKSAGMRNELIAQVRRGALLHDLGKLGVPDSILLKPGKLTDEEWVSMRKHPQYAYDMLVSIEYLRPALEIPYCHHEKWDGTGYPRGLKGPQIPLAARLFAVVDVWDALRSDRPYRAAWPEDQALEYIRSESGKHFDPKAVELFLNLLNEEPKGDG